jgi:hypothetical protein
MINAGAPIMTGSSADEGANDGRHRPEYLLCHGDEDLVLAAERIDDVGLTRLQRRVEATPRCSLLGDLADQRPRIALRDKGIEPVDPWTRSAKSQKVNTRRRALGYIIATLPRCSRVAVSTRSDSAMRSAVRSRALNPVGSPPCASSWAATRSPMITIRSVDAKSNELPAQCLGGPWR